MRSAHFKRQKTHVRCSCQPAQLAKWLEKTDIFCSKRPNETAHEIMALIAEPSLFAHMKYGNRGRVWPNIRHLAPLDGCTCAFEEWVYGGRKVPWSHESAQIISLYYSVCVLKETILFFTFSNHFNLISISSQSNLISLSRVLSVEIWNV